MTVFADLRAARREFANSVADSLPAEVPAKVRLRLAVLAFGVRRGRESPAPTAAERSRAAMKIQAAAAKLTELVDEWYRQNGALAIDHKAHTAAMSLLKSNLTLKELESAQRGLDPVSLRLVLLGLQVRLGAVLELHPAKAGPPEVWAARLLVSAACEAFKDAGLPLSRVKGPLVETCEGLLRKAGVHGSVDDLIREFI